MGGLNDGDMHACDLIARQARNAHGHCGLINSLLESRPAMAAVAMKALQISPRQLSHSTAVQKIRSHRSSRGRMTACPDAHLIRFNAASAGRNAFQYNLFQSQYQSFAL